MKGSPAVTGGSLNSKPTWFSILGWSATSAFLFSVLRETSRKRSHHHGWQDRRDKRSNQGSYWRTDRQRQASRGRKDRPGGRQGRASRPEDRQNGQENREKGDPVEEGYPAFRNLFCRDARSMFRSLTDVAHGL